MNEYQRTEQTPVTVRTADGDEWPAELTVTQDIVMVRSRDAVRPDTTWQFADSAGHLHEWVDGEIPTLAHDYEHKPCDGTCGNWDCEGYRVDRWLCRRCGERVTPEYVPDRQKRDVGEPIEGMKSWVVIATFYDDAPRPQTGDTIDLTLVTTQGPPRTFTGKALATWTQTESRVDWTKRTYELTGMGELAEAQP